MATGLKAHGFTCSFSSPVFTNEFLCSAGLAAPGHSASSSRTSENTGPSKL